MKIQSTIHNFIYIAVGIAIFVIMFFIGSIVLSLLIVCGIGFFTYRAIAQYLKTPESEEQDDQSDKDNHMHIKIIDVEYEDVDDDNEK